MTCKMRTRAWNVAAEIRCSPGKLEVALNFGQVTYMTTAPVLKQNADKQAGFLAAMLSVAVPLSWKGRAKKLSQSRVFRVL